MNIHIFNPEHDIALAADSIFWTAPHAGRQLRADLGWLPVLWANDGDYVLVDDVSAARNAVRKLKRPIGDVRFVTLRQLASVDNIDAVMPWGWDRSLVHTLERYGIARNLMPSDECLATIRSISDRCTAARLLVALREAFPATCGEACVAYSVDEMTERIRSFGSSVVKSPWSSSGRGVRYVSGEDANTMRWAEKVLRTQGHIMVERYLNKVLDFGMEFSALADGTVRYDGLSLFSTTNGAYTGNILATEYEKSETLGQYLNIELLADVQQFIAKWMKKEIHGSYVGPFGIDMMVVAGNISDGKSSSTTLLNPCVEINLRRTMGHVALALSPKENGRQEIMRIGYEGTNYHMRIINDHEVYI